ncbi:hypothetical protein LTR72_002629 [Exophiala xenobiotica]|nr:hypothetical protein LTR72_002629 [Exophiala xenobiotica]KAK5301821.1 hypothetical protein LTR14_000066 [Exophiala xenobiotica]KAK5487800.1 hypothetical protein LTR55_005175 [Exophiala xenobiotica]
MSSPATTASPILLQLIENYHSFNPGGVPVLPYPTYLDFSKQVNRGRPCVYRLDPDDQPARQASQVNRSSRLSKLRTELGSILSCPALSWTKESLCAKVTQDVEVAVTPDGRADSLYPLPRDSPSPNNDRVDTNAETSDLSNGGDQHEDLEAASEHEAEQEEVFVQPATLNMSLSSLFDKLCCPFDSDSDSDNDNIATPNDPPQRANSIYYLQSQNSNLTTTPLSPLLSDLPRNLPFAKPVLGDPEAINIWMGTGASVTSTHRDPYENLYLVLRGKKKFTLYAPVDELCLHASKVRTAHHVLEPDGSFRIALDTPHQPSSSASSSSPNTPTATDTDTDTNTNDSDSESDSEAGTDDNRIPWIPIDPLNLPTPDVLASKYPYYQYSRPLTVTVSEGEILYLPAGWFHHVSQECGVWDDGGIAPCIAVNYWYDMDYEGEKYAMREMLGRLVEAARRETDQRKQSW